MRKLLFLIALRVAAQQPCENLVKLTLPDVAIESATPVGSGDFQLPGGPTVKVPAFCRVVGLVKPELKFELWLPAQWNRKYIAVGNGGMAGSIVFAAMVDPLNRGLCDGEHGHGA